jgi:hypothetical protein
MAISKVVYGGQTLIDLTADTIKADKLLSGYTAHGADGEAITGSCTFDANTQDATASDAEILTGKIAYVRGVKLTGKMKNNGAVSGAISSKAGKYTIPQGYHDGSGTVQIDATEQAKLTAANIREGVTILGVAGTMSPNEGEKAQEKTVIPTTAVQTIVPDDGFTCLSSVTVNAIPYVESENSAGGTTVTIG